MIWVRTVTKLRLLTFNSNVGWQSAAVLDIEREKGTLKVLCDKGEVFRRSIES